MKPTKNRYFCQDARRTKMLFETEGAAKRFIQFNAEEILEEEGKAPVRAYFCIPCAGWHVTSKPEDEHRYKSRIERYFEKKENVIIIDGNKLLEESLIELAKSIVDILSAKNDLDRSKATFEFNLISEKFHKYMKDERVSRRFLQYQQILPRVAKLFIDPSQTLETIFVDIDKRHKLNNSKVNIIKRVNNEKALRRNLKDKLK